MSAWQDPGNVDELVAGYFQNEVVYRTSLRRACLSPNTAGLHLLPQSTAIGMHVHR